jgi:PAS domain S-box-containing protein/diguanylate cyclase (GGDEF)-like protein
MLAVANHAGYLTAVNPSWQRVLGYSPEQMTARPYLEFVHPEDVAKTIAEARALQDPSHQTVEFENRYRASDGDYRWLDWTVWPSDDGSVLYATARDVTERVESTRVLAETERRFRILAENSTDVVWERDVDGVMVWVSPSVRAVLGWEPDDLIGTVVSEVVHPDQLEAARRNVANLLAGVKVSPLETRIARADGGYRWMLLTARAYTAIDGTVLGTLAGLRDIHQQVLARQALAESERKYRRLAENSTDAVFLVDPEGFVAWVSPAVTGVLGYDPAVIVGTRPQELVHPEDLLKAREGIALGAELPTGLVEFELRVKTVTGDFRWMSVRSDDARDDSGAVVGRIATLRDIQEQIEAREELLASENRYRILAENASDVVWQLDDAGVIVWVSQSVRAQLGWDPAELIGRNVRDLIHEQDVVATEVWKQRVVSGAVVEQLESRRLSADGSYRWMSLQGHPVRDKDGRATGLVVGMRSIQGEVVAREKWAHAVEHDWLTGLATMPLALTRLQRWISELPRRGGRQVGLLCVGIDALKSVNEALSYHAGNRLVREVGARLATVVGDSDMLARGSGDEFLVMLPDLVSGADASALADRARTAVHGALEINGMELQPSVSIGVATGGRSVDASSLARDAALAMHLAKDKGRDRVEFAQPQLAVEAQQRLSVETGIRQGLQDREFFAWFQPIVALTGGAVVGFEALIRWVRSDGKVVSPADFLPVAERSHLIAELDAVVLEQSVQLLRDLPAPVHIAVNVSATSLASTDYADHVNALLRQSGIEPSRLRLEVTETALLSLGQPVIDSMQGLADAGIGWYVDDFGTGYSSIAHLRDLPIAGLKLDLSFTAGIRDGDLTCEQLAKGLVGLAEGLGLDTVAEGVETPIEAGVLRAQGWVHGQGWLFGRPAPRSDLLVDPLG